MFLNMMCVGLGGFIGAVLRALCGVAFSKLPYLQFFPFATLCVNVAGSFFIGFLLSHPVVTSNASLKAFLTAGLLGGLTTFSTFTFDTMSLIEHRMFISAFANVLTNVTAALIFCYIGSMICRHFYS